MLGRNRIKIIRGYGTDDLERRVNTWLDELDASCSIVDIRLHFADNVHTGSITAVITHVIL